MVVAVRVGIAAIAALAAFGSAAEAQHLTSELVGRFPAYPRPGAADR